MDWRGPLRRWLLPRHGPSADALVHSGFVALDLETTGLDPRRDAIVSIAAIRFVDGEPAGGLVTLVNPGRSIPASASEIHGIDDAAVAEAPALDTALAALDAVCADRVVVGHGVGFDLAFLARAGHRRRSGQTTALDTMWLMAALHPDLHDVSLEAVTRRLGVELVGRHTAEGDALTAGRVLLAILPLCVSRGFRTVPELVWLQRTHGRPRAVR